MLYDKNDNILDTTNFTYFNEGKCAKLFRDNNTVLKSYKFDCTYRYYFSKEVFDKLKELDLESIVKLYDYFYLYKKGKFGHILKPDAYTMEYVNNPNINLLDQDKEYLLDIMSKLEKDINILTNNKIRLSDAHYQNIIFQEKGAKIIDIDLLRNVKLLNKKKLLLFNKIELLYYIISILKYELKQENLYNYKFECVFNPNCLTDLTVTDYLDKTLKKDIIRNSVIK